MQMASVRVSPLARRGLPEDASLVGCGHEAGLKRRPARPTPTQIIHQPKAARMESKPSLQANNKQGEWGIGMQQQTAAGSEATIGFRATTTSRCRQRASAEKQA